MIVQAIVGCGPMWSGGHTNPANAGGFLGLKGHNNTAQGKAQAAVSGRSAALGTLSATPRSPVRAKQLWVGTRRKRTETHMGRKHDGRLASASC